MYWKDMTYYLYLYVTIVTIIGALLFSANWIRVGKASRVYKYMTFFFYGTAYQQIVNLYSRHLWNQDVELTGYLDLHASYLDLHASWWWATRTVPVAIALSFLVGRMLHRYFFKRKKIMMGTENKDHREDDIGMSDEPPN